MSRLARGGMIDRSSILDFTFDGRSYSGFTGDTLASALIANDVKLVGRSFKYHRRRGFLSCGSDEPNALVTLRSGPRAEPNTRATTVPLYHGLRATSQNRWPSLRCDFMAMSQLFSPLLVSGFYYKTFMWPAAFWEKVYEPLIRRAAGLGKLSLEADPDSYDREHAFCDLLVIGSGPAGLAAALRSAQAGLRIILAEEDWLFGGRLLSERHEINGFASCDWAQHIADELAAMPNVRMLSRTTVFGVFDSCEYAAVQHIADDLPQPAPGQPRQRLWKIIAKHAILASGALERPIVFGGNDRPGVMMASAVSSYVNRFAAAPGRRAVVFATSDSGWRTANDLITAGIEVAAVVDPRATLHAAAQRLMQAGVEILHKARVIDAFGSPLRAIDVLAQGRIRRIKTDLLAVAGGWSPAIGLGNNLGMRSTWCDDLGCFLLEQMPPGLTTAGAAAGAFSLGSALRDGTTKADIAIEGSGRRILPPDDWSTSDDVCETTALWHVRESRTTAFVDFQNDVTDSDVELAAREGFVSVEHLKRYTTLGMATDQGKTSNLNGHALLAAATGKSIAEAGTISSRPPWQPVAIGVLAGRHTGFHFKPERHTSSHEWAEGCGAEFVDVGQWKRARWFRRPGDRSWRDAVAREVTLTRNGVGICDISTLGKIDIQGPDAGTLLDRLYINMFSTLPVGKSRYGLMLREDGFAFDDGTATRFAHDRYLMTSTTTNAALVMQHVTFALQVLWPGLDVQATAVTEQWATYTVAGPKARLLLQALLPAVDLSNEAFPYLSAAEWSWTETLVRVMRLSFSGELSYEVSVPASYGDRLIRRLLELGEPLNAVPYGTEALGVMRIEKGHLAAAELNGQTTARDLGLTHMISKKKDFIGRVLAGRPGLVDPSRPSLVGLRPVAEDLQIAAGAHLIKRGAPATSANDEGYVTSAAWSPTLGHSIALGFLVEGRRRCGEHITIHDPLRGFQLDAEICDPVFIDPTGGRARV